MNPVWEDTEPEDAEAAVNHVFFIHAAGEVGDGGITAEAEAIGDLGKSKRL
jgi:hypothetical protein